MSERVQGAQHLRTLVLNANMMPLKMISWEDAFKRIFKQNAEVLEYYDYSLRDGRGQKHFVPAVIRNLKMTKQVFKQTNFSRANVLKRDNYTCQYCGKKQGEPGVILEMEHVVPRSKWNGAGTPTCWTNIVTSCRVCNRKKADFFLAHTKDHEAESKFHIYMPLFRVINDQKVIYNKPKMPRQNFMDIAVDFRNMKHIPDEWMPYIEHIL